jgi:hypothetical protein
MHWQGRDRELALEPQQGFADRPWKPARGPRSAIWARRATDIIGRRWLGSRWEEVGSRHPIGFPCDSVRWLAGGEEIICFGKRDVSIVTLGTEVIDGRLAKLIRRELTDEERRLINIQD